MQGWVSAMAKTIPDKRVGKLVKLKTVENN